MVSGVIQEEERSRHIQQLADDQRTAERRTETAAADSPAFVVWPFNAYGAVFERRRVEALKTLPRIWFPRPPRPNGPPDRRARPDRTRVHQTRPVRRVPPAPPGAPGAPKAASPNPLPKAVGELARAHIGPEEAGSGLSDCRSPSPDSADVLTEKPGGSRTCASASVAAAEPSSDRASPAWSATSSRFRNCCGRPPGAAACPRPATPCRGEWWARGRSRRRLIGRRRARRQRHRQIGALPARFRVDPQFAGDLCEPYELRLQPDRT